MLIFILSLFLDLLVIKKVYLKKDVVHILLKKNDQYRLQFKHTKDAVYEGIFFKEQGTDFNNGLFKFMKNRETLYVQVVEDYVNDFKNVKISHESI